VFRTIVLAVVLATSSGSATAQWPNPSNEGNVEFVYFQDDTTTPLESNFEPNETRAGEQELGLQIARPGSVVERLWCTVAPVF